MKIVHIITSLENGGAEHTLYKICKYDNQNEHIIISLKKGGKYFKLLNKNGNKIYSLNINSSKFFFVLKFFNLIRLLRDLKPDLVQTWLVHGDFIGGFAAKFAGIKKIVWNIRYSNFDSDKGKFTTLLLLKLLAKLSFAIPNLIVVVSKRSKEYCIKNGYDKKKLVLIQNGYDLSILKFNNYYKSSFHKKFKLKIEKKTPILGTVARYDVKKDYTTLLKSLSILKLRKVDFFCVLVGSNINYKNLILANMIKKLKLNKHIKLIGSQDNITEIMSGIDIYIQSSRYGEGFPNVVAEAMACEVPTVVTDVGDAALIVNNKDQVAPPKNPEKLADLIIKMILKKKSSHWHQIKKQSRLRIKNNFGIKKMIKLYNKNWNKLNEINKLPIKIKKNLNIINVIPRPDGGGAEFLVRKLNSMFNKNNIKVKNIYFYNPNNLKLNSNEYCLNLIGPRDIRAIWYLRKYIIDIKKNNTIFVHAHLTWPLYYTVLATFGIDATLFYTEHNTFNRRRKYFFLMPFERYIYSKYKTIISISYGVKNKLKEWLRYKNFDKKFTVVYNGARLFNLMERKKLNSKKLKLVSIGSLSHQKAFDIAIEAIAMIKDRIQSYTIIGAGEDEKKLKNLAKKLGVEDKVIFAGHNKNIRTYLLRSDLGILSSRWEGFGLVSIEMLSSGLPLVATNIYGLKEITKNCSAVYHVKPESSKILAKGILKQINNIEQIGVKQIGLIANKQSNKFKLEDMLRGYNNIYQDTLKELSLN